MYNDLEVGSYLAWHWQGHHRVFQDPRINGYPPELHAILKRDDLSRPEWEALLDRFGVTAALVTYPDMNPRAALFDPARWALVYRDAEALVFVARHASFAPLIAVDELPITFAYARDRGVTPRPLLQAPQAWLIEACEWQRRLGDALVDLGEAAGARAAYARALQPAGCLGRGETEKARRALGDLEMAAGDRAAAVEAYAGVIEPHAQANRGLALLALGRAAEAQASLEAALAGDPRQPEARLGLAFALEQLGRRDEAAAAFTRFLAEAPAHPAAARARAELARLR